MFTANELNVIHDSHYVSEKGIKAPTKGSKEYKMWERMDFPAVGESLSMEDLAKYRCEFHPRVGSKVL